MLDNFKPVKKLGSKVNRSSGRPNSRARLSELPQDDNEPKEMEFKTPEEVASNEQKAESLKLQTKDNGKQSTEHRRKLRLPNLSKKQWLLVLAVVSILSMGSVTALTLMNRNPGPDTSISTKSVYVPPVPPKTTEPSRLTGVEIPIELNKLPTTGVQIENSPDARPQAGLYDAGVVVEAIAEGGITRFNAMFMEGQPERIGPVRSVRPYYLDFVVPYDAPIAHAGGSGEALAQIRNEGIKDLDHGPNGATFYRDNNRFAPHNLYTSRAKLLDLQRSKGWGTSTFIGLVRKAEKKAEIPTARAIDVNISTFLYNPRFDYDAASNSYLRSLAGKPHVDENGNKQLNPKVVVVLVMPHRYAGIYSVYQTTGTGKAFIFQDGIAVEGTWQKDSRSAQLKFGDAASAPLGLNPGQTWMTLVSTANQVKITP